MYTTYVIFCCYRVCCWFQGKNREIRHKFQIRNQYGLLKRFFSYIRALEKLCIWFFSSSSSTLLLHSTAAVERRATKHTCTQQMQFSAAIVFVAGSRGKKQRNQTEILELKINMNYSNDFFLLEKLFLFFASSSTLLLQLLLLPSVVGPLFVCRKTRTHSYTQYNTSNVFLFFSSFFVFFLFFFFIFFNFFNFFHFTRFLFLFDTVPCT